MDWLSLFACTDPAPPTVIASIYGMNFKVMPELNWHWGYPLAITLMAFAAIGPYMFFRWKKWL